MTYRAELLAAMADEPRITGAHGNVHRVDSYPETPWDWTVDFTTAERPLGDLDMSSLEYGNAETHAQAVEFAAAVVRAALTDETPGGAQ